jgi:hypothetical protein
MVSGGIRGHVAPMVKTGEDSRSEFEQALEVVPLILAVASPPAIAGLLFHERYQACDTSSSRGVIF